MQLVNKVSKRLTIFLIFSLGSSVQASELSCHHLSSGNLNCDHVVGDLSCDQQEIDCYRFDYNSLENFRKSVIRHADRWHLSSPTAALSRVHLEKNWIFPEVDSIENASCVIEQHPEKIYAFGQFVEREKKRREWLYVAEQAFLRSWNLLFSD